MNDRPNQPGTPSLLRAINDGAALRLLLEHGRLSRTELGSLTGLSKPTASQMLMRLERAGWVVSVGATSGGLGRTAELYEVNPAAGHAAGFDVTPGRIDAVVVDLGGRIVGQVEVERVRGDRDAVSHVTETFEKLLAAANLQPEHISHAVLGVPGAYDRRTGALRHAKHLPGWHHPDLRSELAAVVGAEVEIENDVNLVALAEHDRGAAIDAQSSVLLWSGSGVGAATVLEGRLHRGSTGSAGEVGFMPVAGQPLLRHVARDNTGGFQRACGGTGILELGRSLGLHGANPVNMVRSSLAGGDSAGEFLDELATRYATGIASLITVIDPEVVVLSGPVLQAGGEDLRARIETQIALLSMRPVPAVLGRVIEDAVVVGAGHVALTALREFIFADPGRMHVGSGAQSNAQA